MPHQKNYAAEVSEESPKSDPNYDAGAQRSSGHVRRSVSTHEIDDAELSPVYIIAEQGPPFVVYEHDRNLGTPPRDGALAKTLLTLFASRTLWHAMTQYGAMFSAVTPINAPRAKHSYPSGDAALHEFLDAHNDALVDLDARRIMEEVIANPQRPDALLVGERPVFDPQGKPVGTAPDAARPVSLEAFSELFRRMFDQDDPLYAVKLAPEAGAYGSSARADVYVIAAAAFEAHWHRATPYTVVSGSSLSPRTDKDAAFSEYETVTTGTYGLNAPKPPSSSVRRRRGSGGSSGSGSSGSGSSGSGSSGDAGSNSGRSR